MYLCMHVSLKIDYFSLCDQDDLTPFVSTFGKTDYYDFLDAIASIYRIAQDFH